MNSLKYIVTRLLKGAGKSDHENIMTRLDELEKIESQAPVSYTHLRAHET